MAVSASYRTFVLEQLGDARRVRMGSMFGGVGIYWEGAFFGLIDDDALYFRVDDQSRSAYQAAGMKPFDPFKNGQVMGTYWEVPAGVLEDRSELALWRDQAVDAARRAKRAAPRKK